MWKMGACIALSAAMTLTSTGGMLPSENEVLQHFMNTFVPELRKEA